MQRSLKTYTKKYSSIRSSGLYPHLLQRYLVNVKKHTQQSQFEMKCDLLVNLGSVIGIFISNPFQNKCKMDVKIVRNVLK